MFRRYTTPVTVRESMCAAVNYAVQARVGLSDTERSRAQLLHAFYNGYDAGHIVGRRRECTRDGERCVIVSPVHVSGIRNDEDCDDNDDDDGDDDVAIGCRSRARRQCEGG